MKSELNVKEDFEIENYKIIVNIQLLGISNLTDISHMFDGCSSLILISGIEVNCL